MADPREGEGKPADTASSADRRRPGRIDFQDSPLLPLLREQPQAKAPETCSDNTDRISEHDGSDELAAARGIGLGTVIGAVLWAGIAAAFWLLI